MEGMGVVLVGSNVVGGPRTKNQSGVCRDGRSEEQCFLDYLPGNRDLRSG